MTILQIELDKVGTEIVGHPEDRNTVLNTKILIQFAILQGFSTQVAISSTGSFLLYLHQSRKWKWRGRQWERKGSTRRERQGEWEGA